MNPKRFGPWCLAAAAAVTVASAGAKLPPPSDEAKAKTAETAAKAAWAGKVDAYALCKSMDRVAATYRTEAKKEGKELKPVMATPPCIDPGPFVYTPAAAVAGAAPAAKN